MAIADRTRSPEGIGVHGALWTAHDVAAMLGVSHEYIWQLSREGRIPTVSLGRSRRHRFIRKWLYGHMTAMTTCDGPSCRFEIGPEPRPLRKAKKHKRKGKGKGKGGKNEKRPAG